MPGGWVTKEVKESNRDIATARMAHAAAQAKAAGIGGDPSLSDEREAQGEEEVIFDLVALGQDFKLLIRKRRTLKRKVYLREMKACQRENLRPMASHLSSTDLLTFSS